MIFLMIINSKNKPFSGIKESSPKMITYMKSICETYQNMFTDTYKVARFIKTSKGYKKVW